MLEIFLHRSDYEDTLSIQETDVVMAKKLINDICQQRKSQFANITLFSTQIF